ncbi:RecQ mediated genome instability protein Rmi1 [Botrytis cinerea]
MTTPTLSTLHKQLLLSLSTSHLPLPSPAFLAPILTPSTTHLSSLPSLPSLLATTRHRLLSTSLTTPNFLSPETHALPPSLSNPLVKETLLDHDIPVQVLDIQDISRSKSELLLDLEAERLGERTQGRSIIRVADESSSSSSSSSSSALDLGSSASTQSATQNQTQAQKKSSTSHSPGPFKLRLQDRTGATIYAFTSSLPASSSLQEKIGLPPKMNIGCKILLQRGTRVHRGMVRLEGNTCIVLGDGWRDSIGLGERAGRGD